MSLSNPIYLASKHDASELEHSMKLCLMWQKLMTRKVLDDRTPLHSWSSWVAGQEPERLAAHVVEVYELALRRAAQEVKSADASLGIGLEMRLTSPDWLKSVCDPIQKSFLRAMENESVSGHAATLCAIWAAVFHVPLLTALQSALFLEWRARQERQSLASPTLFLQHCASTLSPIFHRHLSCHESSDSPRFAAI